MSETGGPPHASGSSVEYLDRDEVETALDSLSADDKLKLLAVERTFLGGTGYTPKELLHDATCRVIFGERKWPRSVNPVAFLIETMRSITSHARKKRKREVPLEPGKKGDDEKESESPDFPSEALDPLEQLLEKEAADVVAAIQNHFSGDEEAQLVILGWTGDLRGKELRDFVGVDQATLDYAVKRIRRVMKKFYPSGWTS
jgi:DNA-directed RNA polymerase specialized sigma24 family protein